MNDDWWQNVVTNEELKTLITANFDVEHVKVLREFKAMRDEVDYNVYFCFGEDRRRITVSMGRDNPDTGNLVRAFQDQLLS